MRLVLTVTLACAACQAQVMPTESPVTGNPNVKIPPLAPKFHIHTMVLRCEGTPDGVYGRSNGVYYACLGGKTVCSREKRKIPQNLIDEYDANMRAHQERYQAYRERLVREGRSTGDPAADRKAALARHKELVEAKRPAVAAARSSGRISVQEVQVPSGWPTDVPKAQSSPPPPAATEEQVRSIPLGTSAEDVVGQLGEPSFKVTGPTGQFIYPLASGKEAWLEFRNGKLARLRIAPQ